MLIRPAWGRWIFVPVVSNGSVQPMTKLNTPGEPDKCDKYGHFLLFLLLLCLF